MELVLVLQAYETEEKAVAAYIQEKEGKYTSEQIRTVINKYIIPLLEFKRKKSVFIYEKELLSTTSVDYFSDCFRFLFRPFYMVAILLITFLLNIYFFIATDDLLVFDNEVGVYMIVGLLVFILVSSFFHELGHASACKYFGVQHGGIGFGLYLNFPVLYTNVTEIWKLSRWKRCVVNIAGIYFQSYWLFFLLLMFFLTENDILRYLILIMNLGFLVTLNPFFKFDGYWIASDLLGVPNLRSRSLELLIYVYHHIRKIPTTNKPFLLQINPFCKYGLLFYSIIVNLFMGFYFLYIIPVFIYRFMFTFPGKIDELILYISNDMTPSFSLLRNLAAQLLFFILIGYFLYKIIRRYAIR